MSFPSDTNSFVIKRYRELRRTKLLNIDGSVPLDVQATCPACDTRLETLCTLVSHASGQRMRIGLCAHCGYTGYIDRPTKQWNVEYYSHFWDDAEKGVSKREDMDIFLKLKEGRQISVDLMTQLGLDPKKDTICEMGVGYGGVLRNLELRGFNHLIGVENSYHRAQIVNRHYGYPVYHGNFEGPEVQTSLARHQPIKLIFSHHVLEHVYDPSEVIAAVSRQQGIGDKFVLSLPNVDGEHAAMVLLYFSHLHAFSKEAVERLLNKHGYQLIEDRSPNPSNIIIAAEKVAEPKPILPLKPDYRAFMIEKLRQHLFHASLAHEGQHEVYWEEEWRNGEIDHSRPLASSMGEGLGWQAKAALRRSKQVLTSWFPGLKQLKRRVAGHSAVAQKISTASAIAPGYSMIVSPTRYRLTSSQDSPFEIQFDDTIRMLIK